MYDIPRIVTSSCCDADGIQTPYSMIEMMQDCSSLWMESEPLIDKWLKEGPRALVITSRQLDIYRRPAYRERIITRTSVYKMKGPLGFRNTVLLDESGKCVAASWSTGPFLDLAANKMIKPPKEASESMTLDPQYDMEYLDRRIPVPEVDPIELEHFEVVPSDIDFYRHMNNAQYVRAACNIMPQDFEWDRMRVEYKSQAKLGMTIVPTMRATSDVIYLTLANTEGIPFVNLEFSKM